MGQRLLGWHPRKAGLAGRIVAGLKRGRPIPRVSTLVGIADQWRRHLPARARLALEIDLDRRRKSLRIREMRVTASVYRAAGWDTMEQGLIVDLFKLEAGKSHYRFAVHVLAHVSSHALARRFQRGLGGDEASIMRDLHAISQAHHALADRPDGHEFSVPVPASGGVWCGTVGLLADAAVGTDPGLLVRTFIGEGA